MATMDSTTLINSPAYHFVLRDCGTITCYMTYPNGVNDHQDLHDYFWAETFQDWIGTEGISAFDWMIWAVFELLVYRDQLFPKKEAT